MTNIPEVGAHAEIPVEVPSGQLPPAEAANFFHFSFSGSDMQLLVGFVDPTDILKWTSGTPPMTGAIRPEVRHRIVMSASGFSVLRKQLAEIGKKWDEAAPLRAEIK